MLLSNGGQAAPMSFARRNGSSREFNDLLGCSEQSCPAFDEQRNESEQSGMWFDLGGLMREVMLKRFADKKVATRKFDVRLEVTGWVARIAIRPRSRPHRRASRRLKASL